jgi:uncharacterized protein YbcI
VVLCGPVFDLTRTRTSALKEIKKKRKNDFNKIKGAKWQKAKSCTGTANDENRTRDSLAPNVET